MLSAIGLNAIFTLTKAGSSRLDLTENKIYTLSEGTKKILAGLDTPVTIRFYFTEGSRAMPRNLKLYATRVRDFLKQYETYGKGKIKLEQIDVQPDTQSEESANLDQIRGEEISVTEKVYFGISITCLDRKESLPDPNDMGGRTALLAPAQEPMLEYSVSRAITRVVHPEKPKLGLMSSVPMAGNGMPPQMGGQPGWLVHQKLSADYEIVDVPMDAKEIPAGLAALLVVHPANITPESEFAIDQYLLKGGKAAIFLDAFHYFSQQQQRNPMMQQPPAPTSSTLPNLLKAWGLNFESGLVVADQTYRLSNGQRVLTGVSTFTGEGSIDNKDSVTSQLDSAFLILPGGFSGEPNVGLHKQSLVHTSTNTQLMDAQRASMWDQSLLTSTPVTQRSYDMVVRLVGRFPTAFKDGKPKADPSAPEPPKPAEGEKKDEKKAEEAAPLKEPTAEGAVVLFADVDMLTDQGMLDQQGGGMFSLRPNFALVLNTLDQLTGDQNLIGARSRPSSHRPFTVLEEMESKAEEKASAKIKELDEAQENADKEISRLRADQIGKNGEINLDQAQRKALNDAVKKQAEVKKELRELRKTLNSDKERMEAKITWINILVMPAVVLLVGLAVALYRRTRTAAR